MAKAVWSGAVIAVSDDTVIVEGNHYFPREALDDAYFAASDHHTVCSWKGTASYLDVIVDGEVNRNAAWYYPEPRTEATNIKGMVAFWRGVRVED